MKNTAISINVFRSGGGMESYTFDLVKQMTAQGRTVKVYAAKFDDTLPIYRHIEPVLIDQKKIPKKLRPFFFARQLDSIRRKDDCLQPRRPCRRIHLRRQPFGLPARDGAEAQPHRPLDHPPQPQQLRHGQIHHGAFGNDAARIGGTVSSAV